MMRSALGYHPLGGSFMSSDPFETSMNNHVLPADGDATLTRRRVTTASRSLRAFVSTNESDHGVPQFLDRAAETLRRVGTTVALGDANAQGYFAHELRNLVNVAILSFEVLKATGADVAGNSGRVLHGSLLDLRTLINRSLSEVRFAHSDDRSQEILIADFVDDIETAATLEAHAKGLSLVVRPAQAGVAIEGDRPVLIAVVRNLLQNAFKFTRPHSTVTLRVHASAARVLIEVEDECGGLPAGRPDDLFRPFEQRGCDRTGLGLGLAFCQQAVEANRGAISARSLPGRGCVFAIDLPRSGIRAGSALRVAGAVSGEWSAYS
jgi:signal transduction histidine kinase